MHGLSTLCPGAAVRAARPFLPAAGLSCLEYAPFQTGGADGTLGGRKTGRPRQAGNRKTATPDGVTALWRPEKSSVADPRLNQTATQRKRLRFGKEPQQNERAVTFKKVAASDVTLAATWWRRVDSNHRSETQQIYSLPPLATRELLHMKLWSWWTDSNPRPADYKSAALPAELHQRVQ